MNALEARGIEGGYGGLRVLRDVNLSVTEGERRILIGPNGAGKSTLLNVFAGRLRPTAGAVMIRETNVTGLPAHRLARLGVASTFQHANVFGGLSVAANLNLAAASASGRRFSFGHPWRNEGARIRKTAEHFGLAEVSDSEARGLSHGERRQLEIAMALLTEGGIYLLDEPAAGLSPGDRPRLVKVLQELPRTITVVMVEHDMSVAMAVADTVSVLVDGHVLKTGAPEEIRADPEVQRIYLGRAA